MLRSPFHLRKIKKQETISHPKNNSLDSLAPHNPAQVEREIEEQDTELLRVRGFFPIDLFPNELIIRKKSVTIIKRDFLTSNVETFLVKDIGLVQINNAIFFSQIRVSYKAPYEDIIIAKLLKEEAKQAKSLLDRLMLIKGEATVDEEIIYTDPKKHDMYYDSAS